MKHWTAFRKAEVLDEINAGASVADVASKHDLSAEEIERWAELYRRHGMRGLSSRFLQIVQSRNTKRPLQELAQAHETHRKRNRKASVKRYRVAKLGVST